jgi:hypothetical protein
MILSVFSVSLCPWYCLSLVSFTLVMILSGFCHFPFGPDVVCLLPVSLCRQYHGQRETDKRQTTSWPNGNWQRQTISWTKGNLQKTDNIMAKGKLTKDRQHYCLSFVSFPLAMIVSVFCQIPFVHDIVCLFSFPLSMILSVFSQFHFGHDIVWLLSLSLWPTSWPNGNWQRQTISWTKGNWQKTDNIRAKGKVTKARQYHDQRETD